MYDFHNAHLNQNKLEDTLVWAVNYGYQLGSDDALNGIYLSNEARLTFIVDQCKKVFAEQGLSHKCV